MSLKLTRRGKVVLIVLAATIYLAFVGWLNSHAPSEEDARNLPNQGQVSGMPEEDEPGWDCRIHGDKSCEPFGFKA